MKKSMLAAAFISAFASPLAASAGDVLARFDAGFGSQPFALVGGVLSPNKSHGIDPGGLPWAINKLKAVVRADGRISVRGDGLVLVGGNAVGTAGAVVQVAAAFFCGETRYESPAVPISHGGDFQIKREQLSPPLPSVCEAPTLLIRIVRNQAAANWIAGGTLQDPDTEKDDD
jgi:hypothetical protein